ncbi:ARF guanine-nucleotide exchange factor GNOM [Sesamum angolense]|uniref:ARF guanine-nucleotide exchange factor GNOM n=1 Tax=Sesamum angolense TaxID=2727404 RepID=A0AAE2BPM0_9LAMI|nr:ARF guanine-nucleotide exchange factor GNOM [Sesamum angolense]
MTMNLLNQKELNGLDEQPDYLFTLSGGAVACMVNSEIGAVLAVMRRNVRWGVHYASDDEQIEHSLIISFKELRKKIFSWQKHWHTIDPILDSKTVNVDNALHLIVDAVTSCRFEVTDPASEEVVLMKILQVLLACMKNKASVSLNNHHVCSIVNTCFRIVHQASSKSELLQRISRHTMHELVSANHTLEEKQYVDGYASADSDISKNENAHGKDSTSSGDSSMMDPYGVPAMVEIFHFLCSLLNVMENIEVGPRSNPIAYHEDVPLFALGLINSAIELGGAYFGNHPKLFALIQEELFYNLMQFGLSMSPLILSTVCSIVLNLYHHLRTKLKLQLEAFISNVLLRIAQSKYGASYQQQEVAMEALIDFCRQPMFVLELYANYDCDISCSNVFEGLANLLSRSAEPSAMNTLGWVTLWTLIARGQLGHALRIFLDTFRLPGESQKIQRVLEAFAESYFEQAPNILANKDAALLLSYSLIMLNTDQHNAQVKKKMSEEDFIRNNRKINGGDDLPRDFLTELYHSICENEIRMVPDQGGAGAVLTRSHWIGLTHKSKQTSPFIVSESGSHLDFDMFTILSGPAIAAISVVFDHAEQEDVLQSCIDGFLAIAKLSASYNLNEVLDDLIVSICKFTTLLHPSFNESSILYFGDDTKAKMATVAVFTIANRYSDHIRLSWRNILDCILSLQKIGLLPARLASDATDELDSSPDYDQVKTSATPSPAPQATVPSRKSSGLMGRFSLLLSLDAEEPAPQPSEEELAARQRTLQTIQNCHIDSIFAEKKAVFGLLRICQRLLPYKENLTDELLKSLQLVLKLDARVADAYCEPITQEVMHLVKANAMQIRSHMGWRTIISLLSITARHPEASESGFETLSYIMSEGAHLSPANYVLCVNAARQFAESRVGHVDRSVKSLDLMAGSVVCLVTWFHQTKEAAGEEAAIKMSQDILEMWMRLIQSLRKVCVDHREEVRNHAIVLLQRCLTGVEELAQQQSPKDYRSMEGSMIFSLKLMSKTFLQTLHDLSQSTSFCQLWLKVLGCMEKYMKMRFRGKRSEKIHELVPELLKNTLLVMKTSGILVPSDPVGGDSFWQLTWLHVKNIAPSLQLEVFPSEELEKLQEKHGKAGCSPLPDGNGIVPPNETTA